VVAAPVVVGPAGDVFNVLDMESSRLLLGSILTVTGDPLMLDEDLGGRGDSPLSAFRSGATSSRMEGACSVVGRDGVNGQGIGLKISIGLLDGVLAGVAVKVTLSTSSSTAGC
jgi:hypothetical protein